MRDPEHIVLHGKAAPMTVLTPLKPFATLLLRFLIWRFKREELVYVKRLRFIHFAQWTIINPRHFARSAPEQSTDILRRSYFLFSTNYNGPWDQYIDSFSLVKPVRKGMNWLWGTSANFPGAYPVRPFKRYIRYHEYPVDAYYNAYPGATIRDIEAALMVQTLTSELADSLSGEIGEIPTAQDAVSLLGSFSPDAGSELLYRIDDDKWLKPESKVAKILRRFTDQVGPYMGGTQAARAPTLKSTQGPEGLQL